METLILIVVLIVAILILINQMSIQRENKALFDAVGKHLEVINKELQSTMLDRTKHIQAVIVEHTNEILSNMNDYHTDIVLKLDKKQNKPTTKSSPKLKVE